VTADLFKRLGFNVEYAALDWGTVVARRAQKKPPGQGGWNAYVTAVSGADCLDATNRWLRSDGSQAVSGWPKSDAVERNITAWYDAATLDEEAAAIRQLNKASLDYVVYAPLGWYLRQFGWRKNLSGVTQGPMPFFWGVSKTA
jgi:peptide/nickel transport system substrate-binding protein